MENQWAEKNRLLGRGHVFQADFKQLGPEFAAVKPVDPGVTVVPDGSDGRQIIRLPLRGLCSPMFNVQTHALGKKGSTTRTNGEKA